MGSESKIFTLAEVSTHNTSEDCWLIIQGKVYNVTKFLDDHPGGGDVLLTSTGQDATDDFLDVGHSSSAQAMMEEYYVGDIDSSTMPVKIKSSGLKKPLQNKDRSSEFIMKLLQLLVPLVLLGIAAGVRFYTKSAS